MKNNPLSDIHIIRSKDRFLTKIDWLESYHSFSFGPHYNPNNTHHGLLLVSNDDIIKANRGFQTHPHQDMEIVTWVLDGELEHKDSEGHQGIIYPGLAQRMSAGRGIWHSEINPSKTKDVRLVQMWVFPDTNRIAPSYEQLDINAEMNKGGLVPIASGNNHKAAISIRQKEAVLWGGRLKPQERVRIPVAQFIHLYVAKGEVTLDGAGVIHEGDQVRMTQGGDPFITAGLKGAEVLIWQMK